METFPGDVHACIQPEAPLVPFSPATLKVCTAITELMQETLRVGRVNLPHLVFALEDVADWIAHAPVAEGAYANARARQHDQVLKVIAGLKGEPSGGA